MEKCSEGREKAVLIIISLLAASAPISVRGQVNDQSRVKSMAIYLSIDSLLPIAAIDLGTVDFFCSFDFF